MAQPGSVLAIRPKVISQFCQMIAGHSRQGGLKRIDVIGKDAAETIADGRESSYFKSRQVRCALEELYRARRKPEQRRIEFSLVQTNRRRMEAREAQTQIDYSRGRPRINVIVSRAVVVAKEKSSGRDDAIDQARPIKTRLA